MTTVTESDLKELKDLILGIDKKLDIHIARTDEQLKAINNTIAQLDKRTDQRFDDVNRRFDDVNKCFDDINKRFEQTDKSIDSVNARINTFSLGFLSIVGVLVTGLLGIVGKVVFFPNP